VAEKDNIAAAEQTLTDSRKMNKKGFFSFTVSYSWALTE
jgi:hypothetical protein